MPLFAGGFCYIIPLTCGDADAQTNKRWPSAFGKVHKDGIEYNTIVSNRIEKG